MLVTITRVNFAKIVLSQLIKSIVLTFILSDERRNKNIKYKNPL